jgi:hypothetical protein
MESFVLHGTSSKKNLHRKISVRTQFKNASFTRGAKETIGSSGRLWPQNTISANQVGVTAFKIYSSNGKQVRYPKWYLKRVHKKPAGGK